MYDCVIRKRSGFGYPTQEVQLQVPVPVHEVQVRVQEVQVHQTTSTSTKYNGTKLHNPEYFTKILGFTEMHRVTVKHIVLDST